MVLGSKNKWNHTGAILAGGKSRRMRSAKPDVLLPDGRTMLDHVIEPLSDVCKQVVIVGEWERKKKLNLKGILQILDHSPGLGPLVGIETLLKSGLDTEYLVVACDQPFLTPELLSKLIEKPSSNLQLFKFESDDEVQPFPGYYPVSCLSYVQDALANHKNAVHEFIRSTPVKWIYMKKNFLNLIRSINTQEELKELII